MNITEVTIREGVGKDLFIAQYEALRAEIHQRLDQRQQLLTYTLVGAASFFSIGVQPGITSVTILCYPILAFFQACAWGQHDNRIRQLNLYLQEIEDRHLDTLGPGWETYRRALWKTSRKSLAHFVSLPAQGLFVGSQLLALLIGLARETADPQMLVVFIFLTLVDGLAMCLTMLVLKSNRTSRKSQRSFGVQEG